MLAGNTRNSPIPQVHDPMNCADAPPFEGTPLGSRIEMFNEVIKIPANFTKNLNDRPGISGENCRSESRIRSRNARRITKSLARQ